MKEIRERDIELHLVKRVKDAGGECRKVKWIGRSGAPDRLVMLPARDYPLTVMPGAVPVYERRPPQTIWVELKYPGVKAKPHQLREHERMRAMGQRVAVIDSIEGVDELLDGPF